MRELLRRFLPPYRSKALLGIALKGIEVVFDLITPMVVAYMIDAGVGGRDAGLVLRAGAVLILLAIVGYLTTFVAHQQAAAVSQGVGTSVRAQLYAQVMELGTREVDRFGAPSLVTRLTSDVNNVQVAVAMGVRMLIRWPFIAVGSIVAALLIDARLGLVFLVCTPAIGAFFALVMARSVPLYGAIQRQLDRLALLARETLEGTRPIRAMRRERHETERFSAAAGEQVQSSIAVGSLSASLSPATFVIMNLGVTAILWSGGQRIQVGDLTQGELIAFVNYMTQMLLAMGYIANLVVIFTRGATSANRIMEVLRVEPDIKKNAALLREDGLLAPVTPLSADVQPTAATSANAGQSLANQCDSRARANLTSAAHTPVTLAFDGVSFSYGAGAPALRDVSFALPAGGTLGVIGGTGSGKSTLAQLAVRLFDPDEGLVLLDGVDVRELDPTELRMAVSHVPQKASLLTGTIRDNLRWRRPDADDAELWDALERAQAADIVRKKPRGLDENVEAGGKNFSGGQRQRLTIARALVGRPRVVVLDDSSSALDYATDARLRESLAGLPGGPALMIISQRVASVMRADQILVLHHGAVAGLGTHARLLDDCPIYREICLSQLSREEVEHACG